MKKMGLALALLAMACTPERRTDLLAVLSEPAIGPNCASCHPYPPPDPNHVFHLGHKGAQSENGNISCRDCHTNSLLGRVTLVFDSIFAEFDSLHQATEWSGLEFPDDPIIRTFALVRVDTLEQYRPIKQAGTTKTIGFLSQWMTGPAHLNGLIDVQFDSLVSDTARFGGRWGEFHPAEQTCSAIRCHSGLVDYQWAAPSKGLPGKGRYDEE